MRSPPQLAAEPRGIDSVELCANVFSLLENTEAILGYSPSCTQLKYLSESLPVARGIVAARLSSDRYWGTSSREEDLTLEHSTH